MPRPFRRTPLAAALVVTFAVPVVHAEDATAPATKPAVQQMPAVRVESDADVPYKTPELQSPKYTAPLLDTPQAVTVIPKEVIQDQNLLSLRDVLATVPGITFGAGEGGGGYGDNITIRGFTGSGDIALDGIRDSAQYSRSDVFNIERVEVVNGSSSVYSGVGSVGGTINLVSKVPTRDDFSRITAGAGTDSYGRLTLDSNEKIGKTSAVRVNAMVHTNDAPGRDVEKFKRWGLAPSISVGLGTDTQFTGSYFHQHDDNIPQYGVPYFNGDKIPGLSVHDYFGYSDFDEQKSNADVLTGLFNHKFDQTLSLRNITRFGRTTQKTIVDPPQGVVCLDNNMKPVAISPTTPTGYAPCNQAAQFSPDPAPGFYQPSGPRGNLRDTKNNILADQADLIWTFKSLGIEHTLVTGVALTHETFTLRTGRIFTDANGIPPTFPQMDIHDPDHHYPNDLPVNFTRTQHLDGTLDNQAAYVFDTMEFTPQWQLNTGVRYERNEGTSTTTTYKAFVAPTAAAPTPDNTNIGSLVSVGEPAKNNDDLLSYRVGLVFKPVENGSIYAAFGNSKTPSKASVNGSCTPTSTTGTANCTVKPEKALSYEVGTKWGVLNQKLDLTAAVFRNKRTNFRVNDPGNPDNPTGEQQLDGKSRVDGIELSANGAITKDWSIYSSYTYLESKLERGVSKFVADTGADFAKGDDLLNIPKHALNVWTLYQLPYQISVGYGVHYEGKAYLTQHSVTNPDGADNEVALIKSDDYWVHKASVVWSPIKVFSLQLNVNNLFDEHYFARIRNNGWATPGDTTNAQLTASYQFAL